jgi:DNA repair exonuclease SbcCD ATPase subunit
MILRKVKVEGWRCFVEPVSVGPLGDKLNVIHAGNAVGKSSLFDALLKCLFDNHSVTGREIAAVRPWGRAIAPTVEVEFDHENVSYRIRKRFLDKPSSTLYRKENGRYQRLAEGTHADNKLREILQASSPGRGLSKPAHRGLAQILWAPQGNLEIPKLSEDLIANIQGSLGVQISGSTGGPVEARINENYGKIYTPGGKFRTGSGAPLVVRFEEQLKERGKELISARKYYYDFEEASRKIEDIRTKRDQYQREQEEIEKNLEDAREVADAYNDLSLKRERAESKEKRVGAQYSELNQRIETLKSAKEELARLEESLKGLEQDIPIKTKEVKALESQTKRAQAKLEEIRDQRDSIESDKLNAEMAKDYIDSKNRFEELNKQFKAAEGVARRIETLESKKQKVNAPDTQTLRSIRKAIKDRDDARVRLDAALITLEIEPSKATELKILKAEETGKRKLKPGKPLKVKGAPEVAIELESKFKIRAWGPTASIDELRNEHSKASKRLEKLTEPYDSDDLDELERLHDEVKSFEKEISTAESKLDVLLSGRSIDEVKRDISETEKQISRFLKKNTRWKRTPPDPIQLMRAAKKKEKDLHSRIRKAEKERDSIHGTLNSESQVLSSLETELRTTKTSINRTSAQITRLSDDGMTDKVRTSRVRKLATEWNAARDYLKEISTQLEKFASDPRKQVVKLENQIKAIQDSSSKLLEDERKHEGRLQEIASKSPYSTLSVLEEDIGRLKEEITRETRKVEAIRLLHDTLSDCRKRILSEITGPVEETVTKILGRIAGERLGKVHLGETFQPQNVIPKVSQEEVPFTELSGGEKEQLHLAVRLALAEVLSRDERQLVVFDDILTATDTPRLVRILTILEEEAELLQILILTCHPERYKALNEAEFFDLEAIRT